MSSYCGHSAPSCSVSYPQKGRHVKNYIAIRSSHPSSAEIHVQGRGWIPSLSPACPVWDDGAQMELTRDVREFDDDQLWEALEVLQIEMARREGATPHMGHPRAI